GWIGGGVFVNVHVTVVPAGGVTLTLAPPVTRVPSGKTQTLDTCHGPFGFSETVYARPPMIHGLMWCSRCRSENDSPQVDVYGKRICVGSVVGPGVASASILMASIRTRFVSTNVQVTISPGLSVNDASRFARSTPNPLRPCELTQLIEVRSHIASGA